jgi:hypothetical protein
MGADLSAGPGKRVPLRPPGTWRVADGLRNDPPGCSWPKHRNRNSTGRSSGSRLVSVPGPPSRPLGSGLVVSGGLADYSGGPATDSHRLPYSPPDRCRAGSTCRGSRLEPLDPTPVKGGVNTPIGSMSARRHYPSSFLCSSRLSSAPPRDSNPFGLCPHVSSKTTSSRGILVSHPTRSSRGRSANSTGYPTQR